MLGSGSPNLLVIDNFAIKAMIIVMIGIINAVVMVLGASDAVP